MTFFSKVNSRSIAFFVSFILLISLAILLTFFSINLVKEYINQGFSFSFFISFFWTTATLVLIKGNLDKYFFNRNVESTKELDEILQSNKDKKSLTKKYIAIIVLILLIPFVLYILLLVNQKNEYFQLKETF
jgi:hypothetical protein